MLLSADEAILSRHRLPQPYRALLTVFWLTPAVLLTLTLIVAHGRGAVDARLFAAVVLMLLPAFYIWREGVDATPSSLIRRIHVPQRYRYVVLTRWEYVENTGVLRVWDKAGHIALECRAAHLTEFASLIERLETCVKACADVQSGA
ncbi:MAG: hypothetical protein IT320_18255 [Anaerolineae bacterium]|nr:hypothetical protein [Anaerolineae bacterium]